MTGVCKSLLKGNVSPLAFYCTNKRLINVIIIVVPYHLWSPSVLVYDMRFPDWLHYMHKRVS